MRFDDARRLLSWAFIWHAPKGPDDLADSLSCERTAYLAVPRGLQRALVSFRRLRQDARRRMAERYFVAAKGKKP